MNKKLTTALLGLGLFSGNAIADKTNANEIYSEFCAGCHGNQLQRFKRKETFKQSRQSIIKTIQNGKSDLGMPSFDNFDESQLNALTDYIKEFDYSDNNIVTIDEANLPYSTETIVDGLGIIWGMVFLPNGELLLAEKQGRLSKYDPQTKTVTEINGLPAVRDSGQGGLLDLQIHPNYADNGWLYISYSYVDENERGKGNTAIIRAKINNNQLTDIEQIYRGLPVTSKSHHYGSRMVFDDAGYLYFSNGDRGQRDDFPQALDNSNGKIHRLHDDGRIPADNPFVDQANAVTSIYSYGHRNPQGLSKHPQTGKIWEHEHGPRGGDEINIIEKGKNYGWPVISYGINYIGTKFTDKTEQDGMEQPIYYYVPSIAPSGMAFVTSDKYPGWENSLLIGSLKFEYLERLELNGDQVIKQEKLLAELGSRVRDVIIGPDGYIYVSVENPGRVIKLLPKE